MGFFENIANGLNQAFGGADAELMQSGIVGRGQVFSAVPSGGTVQIAGGLVERTCAFQVQVLLENAHPYFAACQQRIPEVHLGYFQSGRAAVAVRVDPAVPARMALDLRIPPPSVRLARNTGPGSAAHILETGTEAVVVLLQSTPAGYRDYRGYEFQHFDLTVAAGVPQPYRVSTLHAAPPEALPLLYPGSRLHARIGTDPQRVIIDFDRGPAAQ